MTPLQQSQIEADIAWYRKEAAADLRRAFDVKTREEREMQFKRMWRHEAIAYGMEKVLARLLTN